MPKIGDTVRFLNTTGGGEIVKIEGNIVHVVDEDGFETPVLSREVVVVESAREKKPEPEKAIVAPTAQKATSTPRQPEPVEEEPIEETEEGETMNVVLAYEPTDLKQIGTTPISTYLVNDSNYFLYFAYMTSPGANAKWTTRYAGIVEPNIQVFLGELDRSQLPEMEQIAVQYIAFKRDKMFDAKKPAWVELSLDTTKFFKLHCFRENAYFDTPVIAYDIVKNDVPTHQVKIEPEKLEKSLKEKIRKDRRPERIKVMKKKPKKNDGVLEVDLHIHELVDNIRGLSNADMLNLQIDEFRRIMDANLNNHGQKIVFIHGKGEGVLRQALMKELNYRYRGHEVNDASFREYGFGATQVTIK